MRRPARPTQPYPWAVHRPTRPQRAGQAGTLSLPVMRPWWFVQVRHPVTGAWNLLSRRTGRILSHRRVAWHYVPIKP